MPILRRQAHRSLCRLFQWPKLSLIKQQPLTLRGQRSMSPQQLSSLHAPSLHKEMHDLNTRATDLAPCVRVIPKTCGNEFRTYCCMIQALKERPCRWLKRWQCCHNGQGHSGSLQPARYYRKKSPGLWHQHSRISSDFQLCLLPPEWNPQTDFPLLALLTSLFSGWP